MPDMFSGDTDTPTLGENLTLQTLRLSEEPVCEIIVVFKNDRRRLPQSRHMEGSHAPGFPRTSRGISTVLKDWVVDS